MKITIESTAKIIQLEAHGRTVPARIWEGETERGIPVIAYVTRISPAIKSEYITAEQAAEFERDLKEQRAPSAAVEAIPLRLIL